MYKISLRPPAQKDVQNIVSYYDDINPILADRFLDELYNCLEFIKVNPHSCQKRLREIRMAFLKKFRFGVHYIIIGSQVVILAVLHTSENPKKWTERN